VDADERREREGHEDRLILKDKIVVVTGGGSGIGRALCVRFAAEGAKAIVVADVNGEAAGEVARAVGGTARRADVAREMDVTDLVARVLKQHGQIDLFCSNAGIAVDGDEQTPTSEWERCWDVNVMAHVYAARAVLPGMLVRGEGYLLQTVSAAGLLTHIQSATYAVTKHASLAFAEWLSMAYGDRGITVSALCPQGVRTDMLRRAASGGRTFLLDSALEPEQVADAVVKGLADERFLILPHPEVAEYFRRKAGDYDRWLRGMRKLRAANP
jgi:NAD(P)-dependent dehydrogenase (short-subunit alcohol dehydrogenase family)